VSLSPAQPGEYPAQPGEGASRSAPCRQAVEIDHDRLLGGTRDHDHRLLVGVGVRLDVRHERGHIYEVAGLGLQADFLPIVLVDEDRRSRDDVDAGLRAAMVVGA
jgi:hypothetical protein